MQASPDKKQKQIISSQNPNNYDNKGSENPNQKPAPSEFLSKYQEFFKGIKKYEFTSQDKNNFNRNNIKFNADRKQAGLNITIQDSTCNYEIVKLAVAFSIFYIQITVFNSAQLSSTSANAKLIGSGAQSKIFEFINSQNQKFAIKSIKYSSHQNAKQQQIENSKKSFQNVIFEYCLSKIFSVLEIGPLMLLKFGFDLLIFNDAIEYTMQLCQSARQKNPKSLIGSLNLMHSFKIIHGDIKHDNVMWSETFNKCVFIDFGFSKLIKQQIGFKTFTTFFGTYQYSSDEMKKLLTTLEFGSVDLYFNDVFSLKKVLEEETEKNSYFNLIRNISTNSNSSKNKNNNNKNNNHNNYSNNSNNRINISYNNRLDNLISNLQIIELIYTKNMAQLKKMLLKRANIISIMQFTIEIIKSIQKDTNLIKIFKMLIQYNTINENIQKQIIFQIQKQREPKQNMGKKMFFLSRIRQITTSFKGTLTQLMLVILLYYYEDVTPYSLHKMQILQQKIILNPIDHRQYWEDFISYSRNPFLTMPMLLNTFEVLKTKLSIQKWETASRYVQLKPFFMAKQIAKVVFQKCNVNLFEIYCWQKQKKEYTSIGGHPINHICCEKKMKQLGPIGADKDFPITNFNMHQIVDSKNNNSLDWEFMRKFCMDSWNLEKTVHSPNYEAKFQAYMQEYANFGPLKKIEKILYHKKIVLRLRSVEINIEQHWRNYSLFSSKHPLFCFDLEDISYLYLIDQVFPIIDHKGLNLPMVYTRLKVIIEEFTILNIKKISVLFIFRIFSDFANVLLATLSSNLPKHVFIEFYQMFTNYYNHFEEQFQIISIKEACNFFIYLPKTSHPQFLSLVPRIFQKLEERAKNNQDQEIYAYLLMSKEKSFSNFDLINNKQRYQIGKQAISHIQKAKGHFSTILYGQFLSQFIPCSKIEGFTCVNEGEELIQIVLQDITFFVKILKFWSSIGTSFYSEPFNRLMIVLLKITHGIHLSKGSQQNFHFYICFTVLIQKNRQDKSQTIHEWIQEVFESLIRFKGPLINNANNTNAEMIILIEILYKNIFSYETYEELTPLFYEQTMRIACLLSKHCSEYAKNRFTSCMCVWIAIMIKDGLIVLPIRRQKKHLNFYLTRSKYLLYEQFQLERTKLISRLSGTNKHVSKRFETKIINSECNRSKQILTLKTTSLIYEFNSIYYQIINSSPHNYPYWLLHFNWQ